MAAVVKKISEATNGGAQVKLMSTALRRLFLSGLVLATACSSFDPLAYTEAPQAGHVLVNVTWDANPTADCQSRGRVGGCAYVMNGVCNILAPRPRSFDDHDRVELVGHEVLHCLGGSHAWH